MTADIYPAWICADCGERYGRRIPTCATWHEGDECGWCRKLTVTTEPRDYGYPLSPNIPIRKQDPVLNREVKS